MVNNLSGGITSKGKLNGSLAIGKIGGISECKKNVYVGEVPQEYTEVWFDPSEEGIIDEVATKKFVEERTIKLETSLDNMGKELTIRKFKPHLYQNPYIRNNASDGYNTSRNKDEIKEEFKLYREFGVEGYFLAIHIGYDSENKVLKYQTNLDTLDYVFNDLVELYGVPVIGIKFHQAWSISNIFDMGESNFKQNITNIFNEVTNRYLGKFEYIGLFNEFASIWQDKGFDYNEKHYCYVDFVNECINMMKNKGLKCSVSIAGSSPTGNSSYRTVSKNILDNSNCILINAYPHVGNKSNYSLQDTKSAWDNASVQYVLEDIANKYGNDKKVIITETGSPDDFRSYFAPANTTLIANPSISNEGGKAIELYLRGMFESRIKDYDILEGVTHWFRIYNGQEITKKTIKKYIYGGN